MAAHRRRQSYCRTNKRLYAPPPTCLNVALDPPPSNPRRQRPIPQSFEKAAQPLRPAHRGIDGPNPPPATTTAVSHPISPSRSPETLTSSTPRTAPSPHPILHAHSLPTKPNNTRFPPPPYPQINPHTRKPSPDYRTPCAIGKVSSPAASLVGMCAAGMRPGKRRASTSALMVRWVPSSRGS